MASEKPGQTVQSTGDTMSRIKGTTKNFTCKRCGYTCAKRAILQGHLSKKGMCASTVEDVSREVLLAELEPKNKLTCATCQKTFIKPGMLLRHRENCSIATVPAPAVHVAPTVDHAKMLCSDVVIIKQQLATLLAEVSFLKGFLLGEASARKTS